MTAILVIRKDDKFSSALREAGSEVVNLELIETQPLEDLSELRSKLANLSQYDGLFFTSPVAAEIFVKERCGSNGFHGNVYALGRRAQNVLESSGLNVKNSIEANTAEEMLNAFGQNEFAGKSFLFVRGEKSLRTIPDALREIASVDEVTVYKTEPTVVEKEIVDGVRSRLAKRGFELLCFFSPSGVERFVELFGDAAGSVETAAIGTTTANAARSANLKVDFISPSTNAEDFARALVEHVRQAVSLSK